MTFKGYVVILNKFNMVSNLYLYQYSSLCLQIVKRTNATLYTFFVCLCSPIPKKCEKVSIFCCLVQLLCGIVHELLQALKNLCLVLNATTMLITGYSVEGL